MKLVTRLRERPGAALDPTRPVARTMAGAARSHAPGFCREIPVSRASARRNSSSTAPARSNLAAGLSSVPLGDGSARSCSSTMAPFWRPAAARSATCIGGEVQPIASSDRPSHYLEIEHPGDHECSNVLPAVRGAEEPHGLLKHRLKPILPSSDPLDLGASRASDKRGVVVTMQSHLVPPLGSQRRS